MKPLALVLLLSAIAGTAPAQAACGPEPLGGRGLYLRGGFNGWAALDAARFTWVCDRYLLVTTVPAGEQRFKVADEGWSADADFGTDPAAAQRLALRGGELRRRFNGAVHRFTLTLTDVKAPELKVESCPAEAPPLGATTLFLRGSMNNWGVRDDYAFQYSCDAYYLNVALRGRHEFKVADGAFSDGHTFGAGPGARLAPGGAAVERDFNGDQTLRLAWVDGRPELSLGARSFADPGEKAIGHPVAASLAFDSRAAAHKAPFGAVVAGTAVEFALDALPGVQALTLVLERRRVEGNQERIAYTELVRLPMRATRHGERERWQAVHRFAEPDVYGYWFEARIDGRLYALQNNRQALHWTRERGTGGAGLVSELPAAKDAIRRFRQTVYRADYRVPGWAADAVYYYIFPERFRNGDRGNDPQPGRDRYQNHTVELHKRWGGKPFRPGSGDGSDEVHNNDFFGGDLAGVIDKLDYIRELGANTIYMTPVFKAASNHKYDTADYRQVDPAFGSNADFERLTREARQRGLRVILDTSLNHVGSDSIYFNRFGNHPGQGAFQGGRIAPASPYFGWFSFDPAQREPDRQFKGWAGVVDLPELDKASPAFRRFAYRDRDSVMKTWLDRGAAGWRMDVAPWVPDDFWREWRSEIKRHQPDALTIAETWFDSSKYLLGDMFDSTMNYIFRNAVLAYAAGGSAQELAASLEAVREAYPPQAFHALMNLLSSHDAPRALHQFGWHEDTQDPATIAQAKRRLLLALFFQMTYPGAPAIYYGDEVGLTGGEDPYNRAPYPWADEGGSPDMALHAEVRKLVALRHAQPVLRHGELLAPLHADEQVLVLARRLGKTWALVAVNNGLQPRRVALRLPSGWTARQLADPLGGPGLQRAPDAQELVLELGPLAGRVWVAD